MGGTVTNGLGAASRIASHRYTAAVLAACLAAGFEPRTRPDPYPDLGTQAVHEGLGIVLYVRTAFGPRLEGSVLVPLEPAVTFPFVLVWREDARSAALDAILAARVVP